MNKRSIAFHLLVSLGLIVTFITGLASCAKKAQDPSTGYGPEPQLPVLNAPNATGLEHPRWVYVLPNGDVLVAETNGPERPDDAKGIKRVIFKFFQRNAGAGVPSANHITLLRDAVGDG